MATVKIKGMRCGHCVESVTKALSGIAGISNVQVDLGKGAAVYEETAPVSAEKIKEVISAIGFEVE